MELRERAVLIRTVKFAELIMPQVVLWALIFSWIAQNDPGVQLITRLLVLLLPLGWLIHSLITSKRLNLPRLALPLILLLIYQMISTVYAPIMWLSLRGFLNTFTYFILFIFLIGYFQKTKSYQYWELALISIGFLFSVANFGLVLIKAFNWYDLSSTYELSLPFNFRSPGLFLNHPNVEAGFINLVLPLIIIRFIETNKKLTKALAIIAGLIFLVNLYFSSSRGAWVAAAVGISVFVILNLQTITEQVNFDIWSMYRKHRKVISYVIIPITVIASIVIIIAFFRLLQSTGRPALWPSRERPWSIGWSLFTTSPFLGNGTGSTKILLALDESVPTEPYLVHTHNLFLQIGSELGLIGIIFVMWLVIEFIRRIYFQLQNSSNIHRIRTAAIAASLSTVFTHHLVDYLLVAPIYVATITILTAYLYSGYSREVSTPQLSLNQSRVFALLSTLFVIAGFYPGGSFAYQKSLNAFTENPSMEAVEHICDVANKHSYQPFFKLGCAKKSAEVSYEDENKSAQEVAMQAYKEALDMDPYWPIHWANLAAVEWETGRRLDAIDHMKMTLESAPDYAITNLNIGRMYENLGEDELAYKHYQLALETEPLLLESAYIDKKDYSLKELIQSKPYSHEFTANYRARVGLYYLFYDQVSAAQEEFLEVIKISPAHPTARSGLAYINLLEGSLEAAQTNIEVALYSGTNTPWIHYIAGKIAYLQGDGLDWHYHFDRAVSLYKNRSDSDRYYNVVYQEKYNNPDTVPQLLSIIISEEARVDFLDYAEEIDEVDPLKSTMITELMNSALPK